MLGLWGCPTFRRARREQRFIESFNNRLRDECLNRNYWPTLLEARVVIEDFKDDHNHRHRSLGLDQPLCDVA